MRIRRDFVVFISGKPDYFRSLDATKTCYGNGQHAVAEALCAAIEFMLLKNAMVYKDVHSQDYVLSQVADFLCVIEPTAIMYESHGETNADLKVFGNVKKYKKGHLEHLRKKEFSWLNA